MSQQPTPNGGPVAAWMEHAEKLYAALVHEFDGFESDDVEMFLSTEEAMTAYRRFRDEQQEAVRSILVRTAPVNVTACPTCGGAGTVAAASSTAVES